MGDLSSTQPPFLVSSASQGGAAPTYARLSLEDPGAAGDGGFVAAGRLRGNAGSPGGLIGALGTIQDTSIASSGPTLADAPVSDSAPLFSSNRSGRFS